MKQTDGNYDFEIGVLDRMLLYTGLWVISIGAAYILHLTY